MGKTIRESQAIWIEARQRWQVKVQKDGERRTFTSSTPGRRGKTEAESKADEWLEKRMDDPRFDLAWSEFLDYQKTHNGTSNYNNHEQAGRLYIAPAVGRRTLSRITPMIWQKAIDAVAANGLSRRSCVNVKSSISAFISYARRQRWDVERLERGDILIPKSAPVGEKRILQPEDMRTLFTKDTVLKFGKTVPAFCIHAWRFIVLTGLREGELCGARNEDLRGSDLYIKRSINSYGEETAGKNDNARRRVALSDQAMAVLAAQRAMLKDRGIISPWIFPDEQGERMPPRHLFSMWLTYRKQHGISASIHEMRHTFISIVKNDLPLPMLKALVGHSDDMDTYGVYGHEVNGEMRQAAKIIDQAFSKIVPIKPQK